MKLKAFITTVVGWPVWHCEVGMKWGKTKVSHSTVWCVCVCVCGFIANDHPSIYNGACTWSNLQFYFILFYSLINPINSSVFWVKFGWTCACACVHVCLPAWACAHLKWTVKIFRSQSKQLLCPSSPLNLSYIFICRVPIRYDDEKWWNCSSHVITLICSLDSFIRWRMHPLGLPYLLFQIT